MNLFRKIIFDLRTYLLINYKYKHRYKHASIYSFIPPTTNVGCEVTIKPNCLISENVSSIGNCTYIGNGTKIMECSLIGNFCSISHDVKIGLTNHPSNLVSTSTFFYEESKGIIDKTTFTDKIDKRTKVEHDVLISANAMIMNGVTLGTGCIVAAGAFVKEDVPPYAIVAGIPAKIIRYRFDEKAIEKLLSSNWWNMDLVKLKSLKDQFGNVDSFVDAILNE